MSELAFNINGEPFDMPPMMAAWRVRKLKPKGAPEVVYGRDGLPLFLPIDADIEDLRHEARGEGRYRLDPVDEHNRLVPNSQASYVCVHPIERAPEPAATVALAPVDTTAQLIAALLESQKQHTELARMYVSQFPVLANAMAGVVRSAGDVGLTARVPLVLPAVPEAEPRAGSDQKGDEDDEEEIEESNQEALEEDEVEVEPEPEYSWARVGQTFADHVGPYVGPLLAGVPGLANLLGAHGGKTKTDATSPGPGPSDPAPASGDVSSPSPVLGLDPAMLVRLRQIMAQLTPEEDQFARSLIEEIAPEDMASWIDRLRSMSIPEAVTYIRTMFRQARADARDVRPADSRAPAPPTTRRAGYAGSGNDSDETATAHRSTSDMGQTRRPARATHAGDGAALRDAGTQAHLERIERALSADERTAMRKHFMALSPSERSLFVATLLMLPVADAVATVRGRVGVHPAPIGPTSPAGGDTLPVRATIDSEQVSCIRPASTPARKRTAAPGAAPHDATPSAPNQPTRTATDATASPVVASGATPSAAASDAPATVERNAHTHLAEIESTLVPEERLVVHTLFSELSPDDRDVWLDRLLSRSVADGAAMLRATIQAATTEAPTANAINGATASKPLAAASSDEPDPGHATDDTDKDGDELGNEDGDELDGDELDGDDDELDGADNQVDGGEVRSSEPVEHQKPDQSAAQRDRPKAPPRVTAATPAIATGAQLPTLDADSLAHFQAIDDALTLAERMRANELAALRPAAELRRWYAELVELSVPEAVAKIRAELARCHRDSQSTKKGGVS